MQLVAGGHRPDSLADSRANRAGNPHDHLARRQFAGGRGDALRLLLPGAVNESFGADPLDRFHGEAERDAAGYRFVITNEMVSGGVALGLTVEAIERVGAETFIYGTRQQEAQGVAATPGELPPGEVIVRIPGAVGPAIGERIRAVAASDKLHLFTADGRKRVGG